VASRLFSEDQLEALKGFPDIDKDELIRFFTLTPADVAFVDPGRGRGPADRLSLAVQLCTLPWLGFVPDQVWAAPPVAAALTYQKVAHLLIGQVMADLDLLLRFDVGLGMTRLAWLTAMSVKTSIEKLKFLRAMDAHVLDLSMLAAERRRFLATVGRRSTNQALERRESERRYRRRSSSSAPCWPTASSSTPSST
jgi:hypothetical protein